MRLIRTSSHWPTPSLDISLSSPEPRECCQWWAPTSSSEGKSQHLADSHKSTSFGDGPTLEDLVFSGRSHVSCAIRARPLLNTATCRPDWSCGLQMACLISLVANMPRIFLHINGTFCLPTSVFCSDRLSPTGSSRTPSLTPPGPKSKAPFIGLTRIPADSFRRNAGFQYVLDTDWDVALGT